MSAVPVATPASPLPAPGARMPAPTRLRRVFGQPMLWLFAAILVVGALSSDYFLTGSNMENLLRNVAVFGFLALGSTLVMITGRIDLSVGAVMVFSVIAAIELMGLFGGYFDVRVMGRGNSYVGPAAPLVLLTLGVGALIGLANGIGVAYGRVAPFIMTLVSLSALRGLSYVLSNGRPYYLRAENYKWLGETSIAHVPLGAFAFALAFAVVAWLLHVHVAGKRLYAIGGDEKTARYAGIRVQRWVVLVYVLSGLCAACAGVLFTSRLGSVDAPMGAGYELTAIAITVLGGTSLAGGHGSPYRTLCATLAFAAGLNLLTMQGVNAWYQDLVVGIVLVAAVALARRFARPGAA